MKYLLLAVDIFSRFVSVQPLKNKSPLEVTKAFKIIFEQGKKPKLLRTDKGKEFSVSVIEKYFKKIGIHHFDTQIEGKANYAKHAIKTIENSIYRYIYLFICCFMSCSTARVILRQVVYTWRKPVHTAL